MSLFFLHRFIKAPRIMFFFFLGGVVVEGGGGVYKSRVNIKQASLPAWSRISKRRENRGFPNGATWSPGGREAPETVRSPSRGNVLSTWQEVLLPKRPHQVRCGSSDDALVSGTCDFSTETDLLAKGTS